MQGDTVSTYCATASQAERAMRWLRERGLVAFYREMDKELHVYTAQHGNVAGMICLEQALQVTA